MVMIHWSRPMKCFYFAILLFHAVDVTEGLPYLLITGKEAKCLEVSPPRHTVVTIKYHFPDIVSMAEDMEDPKDIKELQEENSRLAPDELSRRYHERYQRKIEEMKTLGRKMGDTSITARQRFDAHSNSRNQRHRHVDGDQGTGHFREQVKEKHGLFRFTSSPRDDAPLEICVQSLSASHYTPIRFSLQILMEPYFDKASEEAKLKEKLDGTVSTMQLDLQGLEQKLEMILAYSESATEQEIRVHNRSISINRSSMYWPLIQIVILIVAGFMQANIVSKFFKKHHIV